MLRNSLGMVCLLFPPADFLDARSRGIVQQKVECVDPDVLGCEGESCGALSLGRAIFGPRVGVQLRTSGSEAREPAAVEPGLQAGLSCSALNQ